jgi:DeoR family transcriptional regulator, fructose operon transcriptional repressor
VLFRSGEAGPMQQRRLDYITKAVRAGRFVSLREVAETFDVNMQTARRDVAKLAEKGLLAKTHGGAMPITGPDALSLDERIGIQESEKDQIGRAAAVLVQDNDIIIMDGGSTNSYMLPYLRSKRIQIVTNSISLLSRLDDSFPGVEAIVTGGYYYQKSALLLGRSAVKSIKEIHADKAFISAAGVDSSGVYNSNMLVVDIERAMIEQSAETILLVDSTKIGKSSLVKLCGFDEISKILTVGAMPSSIRLAAEEADTQVCES